MNNRPDIDARLVRVTPALAAKWLERNPNNRSVSMGTVQTYAADMKNDRWRINGATVVFNKHDQLIDGQHRLWAVMESGVSVDMLIVEGVDDDAKLTIDGGRPRRPSDRLWMFGRIERPQVVAASLVVIDRAIRGKANKVSTHELWEQYERYRPSFSWALGAVTASFALRAPVYGALVFAHRSHPAETDAFARELQSRDDQPKSPATALLRNYFLVRRPAVGAADQRVATFLKTLRCVQAFVRGERPTKLYASDDVIRFFDWAEA